MAELANKTFFRFLMGFLAIVATSFFIITLVGFYEQEQRNSAQVTAEDCNPKEEAC